MVPLEKELDFIRNYVELMRIRLPEHVKLTTDISAATPETQVAVSYTHLDVYKRQLLHRRRLSERRIRRHGHANPPRRQRKHQQLFFHLDLDGRYLRSGDIGR